VNKGAPAHPHPELHYKNFEDDTSNFGSLEKVPDLIQLPFSYNKMGSVQHESHFKKLQNFKADYADATFTQYESQRTGLRVVVVDRKGPKVYGNFAVATEIHDDSGSRKL
jgi:hypothetical protein